MPNYIGRFLNANSEEIFLIYKIIKFSFEDDYLIPYDKGIFNYLPI
jgi:hypothetical protein